MKTHSPSDPAPWWLGLISSNFPRMKTLERSGSQGHERWIKKEVPGVRETARKLLWYSKAQRGMSVIMVRKSRYYRQFRGRNERLSCFFFFFLHLEMAIELQSIQQLLFS